MHWYYVANGERRGPVGAVEFEALVAAGTIGPETLVWREGMGEWRPHRLVTLTGAPAIPAAPAPGDAPAGPGQAQCSECGRVFAVNEVLDYGGRRICADCKPAFFQRMREAGGAAAAAQVRYAGFWIRLAAKFIDGVILATPLILLMLAFLIAAAANAPSSTEVETGMGLPRPGPVTISAAGQGAEAMLSAVQLGSQFCVGLMAILYNGILVGRYGTTVGKKACGLRVVRSDGSRLTYGRSFGRAFAEVLSRLLCSIGYLIAAFDNPQKRALHDHICDTRVIYQ